MRTKIFCDIADYKTIKFFNNKPIVNGFTTNPSLMRLAGAKNYRDYSLKILKICKKKPISFEVLADNLKDILPFRTLIIGKGILKGRMTKYISKNKLSKNIKGIKKKSGSFGLLLSSTLNLTSSLSSDGKLFR